jgi:hypothetical protein
LLPFPFRNPDGGNVKVLPKEEFRDLAAKNGWSEAFAEGYLDGTATRRYGAQTPNYPLGDLDEYRQGFLAGYSLTRVKRC